MTENEEIQLGEDLRNMISSCLGWKHVEAYIDNEIREGWEKFIRLPAEKKTLKTSFEYQAQYKVLKNLKEWISDAIKNGQNAEDIVRKEKSKQEATTLQEAGIR